MEINILLLVVILFLLIKMYDGYNKGMVKEIISFVSLIFLCLVAVLAGNGVSSYYDGQVINVIVAVLLLAVLGIVHYVVNVVLLPAKLVAKLPVVKSLDKILGVAVGILETILILWTIYLFVMVMDLGAFGDYILQNTSNSQILTWFYEHNQLADWIQMLGAELNEKLHIEL